MESVAQSIVTKFGQVLVEELKEIRGAGDKVVHLRDDLATMNAVLRVISEAEQGSVDHVIREWEKQVHDLVYDAEDCTDIYSIRIIRPIPRLTADDVSGTPITFWARYLFARAKHFARYHYEKLVLQRTLAADINALLARTTIVSERRARYGIDQLARLQRSAYFDPVSAASTSASALHHISDPHQFVALNNDDLDQFVALNRDDDPQDHQLVGMTEQANALAWKIKAPLVHKRLEVFTIVGSGGLGKTALAMELCRLLDVDFPSQAQVSVSQEFDVRKDMKGLLVRMLGQILQKKLDDKQTNKEHLKDKDAMGTETHDNELQIEKMDVDDLSKKIKELTSL